MPLYTYLCQSCGLRFDLSVGMIQHENPQPCTNCKQLASREMPTQVSGVFHQTASGPVPQNTGLSGFDAHTDRVIGDSARQGWEVAQKRVDLKRKVLSQNPGREGRDLSKNPDGSYRVLAPEERGVSERSLKITQLAMEARKKALPPR